MVNVAGFGILTQVKLGRCFILFYFLRGYLNLMFFNTGFAFYWVVLVS
jgi:hypothetical protein